MKIFIYKLTDLTNIIKPNFRNCNPEMDLFDLFFEQLTENYDTVLDINDADIAFIPIDYTVLIYMDHFQIFTQPPELLPPKPPPYGSESKGDIIKFFWEKYVNPELKDANIPHFMLYPYVLFDIDFSSIPENIYILSYEKRVTDSRQSITIYGNGTFNRMIVMPYILNEDPRFNHKKLTDYYFKHYSVDELLTEKRYDLGFFGSISKERTDVLYENRKFLLEFNQDNSFKYITGCGEHAESKIHEIKYLFVLRGDTPTRKCFYQCFALGCVPIIYETDFLETYSHLIMPSNIDLKESAVLLPNPESFETTTEHCNEVERILREELSDERNFLNGIKNHQTIFDNFNYFDHRVFYPIHNVLNRIIETHL